MTINSTITHKNGGFEQGILQVMEDEGLLRDKSDRNRLDFLKSLPQNRTEIINSYEIEQEAAKGDASEFVHFHLPDSKETELHIDESVTNILGEPIHENKK